MRAITGAPGLETSTYQKVIKTTAFRYGIGFGAFVLTVIVALILQHFAIVIDLSLLVIGALIFSAWYGGRGPGLVVALLFELTYLVFSKQRPSSWPAMVLVEFNRTSLLLILALLVSRLKEQREWLRVTLSSIADGVIATALNGQVRFMNPTAEAITGFTRSEASRRRIGDVFQIVSKDSREIRENPILRAMRSGETVKTDADVLVTPSDGKLRPVYYCAAPMHDDAGKTKGAVIVFRDLTERLRLYDQLRQSQKMEAIGRLAGGIAHDFNNLLTVILGYGALASQRGDVDRIRQDLEEIQQAGQRAAALVGQLLAFSRQQVLQPRVIDLNEVITGTHSMLRRVIGEDIDLVCKTRPDLGHVLADAGQIEQIILNLAVNARDAMLYGGKLTIETLNVELDAAYARTHPDVVPGLHVLLAVSDTGQGMDAETQARIFEPFFTTKLVGKGTGLGLATVYGIVKQSGGHIWVYSEPGQGAAFKVYFPRVDEPVDRCEQHAVPLVSLQGSETILLAEDEDAVRELARSILRGCGYNVLAVTSGTEAIAVAESTPDIALLITDVVMPKMSGRQLSFALAEKNSQMRTLYISGYTENAIVHHGVLDHRVAFLPKPFTPDGLARKVRDVLDNHISADANQ